MVGPMTRPQGMLQHVRENAANIFDRMSKQTQAGRVPSRVSGGAGSELSCDGVVGWLASRAKPRAKPLPSL